MVRCNDCKPPRDIDVRGYQRHHEKHVRLGEAQAPNVEKITPASDEFLAGYRRGLRDAA